MDEWSSRLTNALGDRKLDYLILSHLEPNHSGSILKLLSLYPDVTIVGNAKTFAMLPQFFDVPDVAKITVKEGDNLELGNHTLTFYMAPMVHWPEVMVSYENTEKILFSADGFGKFGALSIEDEDGWACEARRYYFNIVGKYGGPVQTLLKKASTLEIKTICPLHGYWVGALFTAAITSSILASSNASSRFFTNSVVSPPCEKSTLSILCIMLI